MATLISKHSIAIQIQEVEREIRMRREVYPRRVHRHTMRQGEADEHIARMESVLQTLQQLQRKKEAIE